MTVAVTLGLVGCTEAPPAVEATNKVATAPPASKVQPKKGPRPKMTYQQRKAAAAGIDE
jgi:hypothetical protein